MSMEIRTLNVKVITPTQILFQGPALSVSSKNLMGGFDVLPEHANMITFIEAMHPIEIRTPDKKKVSFKFPMAIIHVTNNTVTVYSQPEVIQI